MTLFYSWCGLHGEQPGAHVQDVSASAATAVVPTPVRPEIDILSKLQGLTDAQRESIRNRLTACSCVPYF